MIRWRQTHARRLESSQTLLHFQASDSSQLQLDSSLLMTTKSWNLRITAPSPLVLSPLVSQVACLLFVRLFSLLLRNFDVDCRCQSDGSLLVGGFKSEYLIRGMCTWCGQVEAESIYNRSGTIMLSGNLLVNRDVIFI